MEFYIGRDNGQAGEGILQGEIVLPWKYNFVD